MTCREIIEFLMGYVNDELPEERKRVFEAHLTICIACQNYLDSYKKTILLEKAALAPTDDSPPPELPEELIRAIVASRPKR